MEGVPDETLRQPTPEAPQGERVHLPEPSDREAPDRRDRYILRLHRGSSRTSWTRKGRKLPDEKLNAAEISRLRSLFGERSWPSREGFPEMAYDISDLQQRLPEATATTILRANSVLRVLQQRSERPALHFPRGDGSGRIVVGVFTDASFDRQRRGGSQAGGVLFIGDRRLVFEKKAPVSLVSWKSSRIKGRFEFHPSR